MKILVVTNMYPTADMPAFGTFVRDQVEALRQEGIDIDVFFINGRKSTLNYLWSIPRLWLHLLTHRYDLLHAHYILSGIVARLQCLYPVVLTHHGLEVFMTWHRYPSHIFAPLVDKNILVSREQEAKLKNNKAVVIPFGIDFDSFCPMPREEARQRLGLPPDKKLVLWAGEHFRWEKRFDTVKTAVALAQQKDPSVELVLVSGKPHDLVPFYMNACDVLLLVSVAEGSPMVIKEAMACNLPIVSTPVGDVPEVINGVAGCYLCSANPSDVAEKLLLAINHRGRTEGRAKIGHLEKSAIARRTIAVYREVLNGKKGKASNAVAARL